MFINCASFNEKWTKWKFYNLELFLFYFETNCRDAWGNFLINNPFDLLHKDNGTWGIISITQKMRKNEIKIKDLLLSVLT